MLKKKYPIGYDLKPTEIEKGTNWISLLLKNIGSSTLQSLEIQEHSVDTYNLQTFGTFYGLGSNHCLKEFKPDEEIKLDFKINALGSADVYVTIRGLNDEKYFWWESSRMNLHVSDEKARIDRLLVLSNPYAAIGNPLSAEAVVKGLKENGGLKLEFWVESPSRTDEKQATIDILALPVGKEVSYTVEFTPKETGLYTISAHLYDGWRRIGYKTETIYAQKP
jgi:hypothetical protein